MLPAEPTAISHDLAPAPLFLALVTVAVERGLAIGSPVHAPANAALVARAQGRHSSSSTHRRCRGGHRVGECARGGGGGGGILVLPASEEAEKQRRRRREGGRIDQQAAPVVARVRAQRVAALVQHAVVGRWPLGEPAPVRPARVLAAGVRPVVQRRVDAAFLEAARFGVCISRRGGEGC